MNTKNEPHGAANSPQCQRSDEKGRPFQNAVCNGINSGVQDDQKRSSDIWNFVGYPIISQACIRRNRCGLKAINTRRLGCSGMGATKWLSLTLLLSLLVFGTLTIYKRSVNEDNHIGLEKFDIRQSQERKRSENITKSDNVTSSSKQTHNPKRRSSLGSPFNAETFDNTTAGRKKYVILYWSKIRGFKPRIQSKKEYEQDPHIWPYTYAGDKCPVSCELTNDRDRAKEASAFVVHSRLTDVWDLPPLRYLAPWILQNNENPVYTPALSDPRIMSKFNLLISYRLDSDFPSPIYPKPSLDPPIPFKNRLGNVLAVFSKCEPIRTEYMRQLMKYIDVHSYGACLKNKKGLIGLYSQINGKYVFKDYKFVMSRYYKFSLVFMNQDCDYFVDDRLYHALETGSIPIYMGTGLIDQFLPSNLRDSIIRASDFKSPKELAEYINYVANNETEFNKYLEWKWKGIGEYKNTTIGRWWDQKYPLFCQVCMRLSQGKLHPGLDVDKCKPRSYEEWGLEPPYPKVFSRKRQTQDSDVTKQMLLYWKPLFVVTLLLGVILLFMNCCVWCLHRTGPTLKVEA